MSTAQAPLSPHILREYAFLADGERGVLVGPRGDFAWMCFPRWHDDAVFCSLVGGESVYSITPRGRFVWGGHYEPPGLIWRSRWITERGIVECREALAAPSRPGAAILLRRLIAVDGDASVDVCLRPGGHFDRFGLSALGRQEDGTWTAHIGEDRLRWIGGAEARETAGVGRGKGLELTLDLKEGETHDFALELLVGEESPGSKSVDVLWEETEEWWRERVPSLGHSVAPRDARHAYAVMAGLTSAGGGMVAAATTSLPERAGAGRSYDYRYVWIRDQCYAGQAVARSGPHPLMDEAVGFVTGRILADGPDLMPAYTVGGDAVPAERKLELPGYPGGTDIAGNWVRDQFQLDAFGEALLLFAAAADHDHLGPDQWRAVEVVAAAIAERSEEPEAGIWEIEPRRWTQSRLICVAGLRAIAAHAPGGQSQARWLSLADSLLAAASSHGVHDTGRWMRADDDEGVDASLLLAAIRGAVPARDPRSLATLAAVEEELTEDRYCYRFRSGELPLGEAEGAFLLCGFWLALAYAQLGDHVAATSWFDRNRSACGSPGLLAEEFDVTQRQLRGNLPQAFVHALLLESAVVLGEADGGRASSG